MPNPLLQAEYFQKSSGQLSIGQMDPYDETVDWKDNPNVVVQYEEPRSHFPELPESQVHSSSFPLQAFGY